MRSLWQDVDGPPNLSTSTFKLPLLCVAICCNIKSPLFRLAVDVTQCHQGRGAGLLANDHGGHHFAMLTSRAAMLEAELKQRDMEVARLHQLLEDYQLDDDALRTENDESLETELSTQELLEEERAESALLRDTVDEVTAMLQAAEDALEAYRQNDSQGESDGDGGLRRRRMTLADEMMDISDERAKVNDSKEEKRGNIGGGQGHLGPPATAWGSGACYACRLTLG